MSQKILLLLTVVSFYVTSTAQKSNFKAGALTAAVVVSNESQSLHFYTGILGMQEVGSFTIDSIFAKRLGLSQGHPFKVTRLAFHRSPESSELKIVSFDLPKAKMDSVNSGVQRQLGLQYLTLQVHALDPVLERAKKEGLMPEADTPVKLGEHSYLVVLRDPDGVFVELIGDYSKVN